MECFLTKSISVGKVHVQKNYYLYDLREYNKTNPSNLKRIDFVALTSPMVLVGSGF